MNNTIQINIAGINTDMQHVLIAELSSINFDAFEQKDNELDAFADENNFDEQVLIEVLKKHHVDFKKTIIPPQNWNELWESNFQPISVDDFCFIRADFHAPVAGMKHEIVITPKMSFGTGHHPTTHAMIQQMRDIDFENKSVADFGTGTGILAIMAIKLGSKSVWAIDNDDWSIENATENIAKNNCQNISLEKKDEFGKGQKFEVVLANINRNVILENVKQIAACMAAGSTLLLSGLLKQDEEAVTDAFKPHNILQLNTLQRGEWISIMLKHAISL